MNDKTPAGYNPLDHEQRIARARERQSFFRQVGLFPAVALAMMIFVAVALARPAWAAPYLLFMMVACGLAAGLRALLALLDERAAATRPHDEAHQGAGAEPAGAKGGGLGAATLVAIAALCLAPVMFATERAGPLMLVSLGAALALVYLLDRRGGLTGRSGQ